MKNEKTIKNLSIKVNVSILASLFLAGCVGMETSYKAYDSLGGGYGEVKVTPDTYIIYIKANDFTEPALTSKYFLTRSAQIALKNDFDCFVIAESKKTMIDHYVTTNKLALQTEYYSADTQNFKGADTNKFHENSLSGIIQLYKAASAPSDCKSARTVLESHRTQ